MTTDTDNLHVCAICDDEGADWTDEAYEYHKSCVLYRIANPNNSREERGLKNTLAYGHAIAA